MSETWTDDEPGVLTTGRLSTRATPAATAHVERARLARNAQASQVKAKLDPDGDIARVLSFLYASTPLTIMRAGSLALHCGLTEDRASEVLDILVGRGLLGAGATTRRVSLVGPVLAEQVVGVAS
jgi:hypothetical protein